MPIDLREAIALVFGFWLSLWLLMPLVSDRQIEAPQLQLENRSSAAASRWWEPTLHPPKQPGPPQPLTHD